MLRISSCIPQKQPPARIARSEFAARSVVIGCPPTGRRTRRKLEVGARMSLLQALARSGAIAACFLKEIAEAPIAGFAIRLTAPPSKLYPRELLALVHSGKAVEHFIDGV